MNAIPPISRFMFPSPLTIERTATVHEAREKMEKYGIRHLPVIQGEKVTSLVSSRDIELACACEARLGELQVHMVMGNHVYTVEANTPVDTVLSEMIRYKYGSTVVVDRVGKPIGIFTSIDAMSLLGSLLRQDAGSTIDLSACVWPVA